MTQDRIKEVSQGYRVNSGLNYIQLQNYAARRLMAQSSTGNQDPELPRNYYLDTGGCRVYHTEESRRLAEIKAASTQVFKRNMGHGTIDNNCNNNVAIDSEEEEVLPKEVTESSNYINKGKNPDMPLMFKIAARTLNNPLPSDDRQQPQQQQDPSTIQNQQMAQYIVESLKGQLATGQEYSASDLEKVIRAKFPNVDDSIVASAVNMILNDTKTMKSKVAGTYKSFKLMVSARNPVSSFGKQPNPQTQPLQQQTLQQTTQQNQQNTPTQQNQQPNNDSMLTSKNASIITASNWPSIRSKIII
jgi:hypothetical protein